jgi:hypothetical protein
VIFNWHNNGIYVIVILKLHASLQITSKISQVKLPHVIMHHNSIHIIKPHLSLLVTSSHLIEQTNGKDNFIDILQFHGYLPISKFQEDI